MRIQQTRWHLQDRKVVGKSIVTHVEWKAR
jgi:hypothetical protein